MKNNIDYSNKENNKSKIIMIIILAIISCQGIFIGKKIPYYTGLLVFLLSYFGIINHKNKSAIIGIDAGICLMIVSLVFNALKYTVPIYEAYLRQGIIFLVVIIALIIIATIYLTVYCLNEKIRSIRYSNIVPLVLYTVCILMAVIYVLAEPM